MRRATRTPDRSRAGFTLAEVLLTVLIMSGILISIAKILQAARNARDVIHNAQENQLAGPAIMDLIERDIRGLLITNRTLEDQIRVVDRVMHGLDGDSLDFVTTTNSLVSRQEQGRYVQSDVNEVGYRLRPNPNYDDFLEIYRREDMGVDEEPYEGGEFSFLHDRVKSFDIQVFSEDGPDAEPIDEWGLENSENIGVPARLEISMTIENANRIGREALRHWTKEALTVTYRRVIRLPEYLRVEEQDIVVMRIPTGPDAAGAAVAPGGTPTGEEEFPNGDPGGLLDGRDQTGGGGGRSGDASVILGGGGGSR